VKKAPYTPEAPVLATFDFRLGWLGWELLVVGTLSTPPFGQPRNDSNPQVGVKRTNRRFPA
jgi:hypothetical protein